MRAPVCARMSHHCYSHLWRVSLTSSTLPCDAEHAWNIHELCLILERHILLCPVLQGLVGFCMRKLSCGRRFWLNGTNPKRMYVLENVRDFVQLHNLQAGSTLSFYYAPDNRLVGHLHNSLPPASYNDRNITCLGVQGLALSCRGLWDYDSDMKWLFASAIVLSDP